MKDIKECVETLFFHIRQILALGEIVLLYAEDLSVYVRRRHRFHPADHTKLNDISALTLVIPGIFGFRVHIIYEYYYIINTSLSLISI